MAAKSTRQKLIDGAGWGVVALIVAAAVHGVATSPEILAPPKTAIGPARDYAMFVTEKMEGGKVVTGARFATVEDQAAARPAEEWCYFEKTSASSGKQSFYIGKQIWAYDYAFSDAEIEGLRAMGAHPDDVGLWMTYCHWIVAPDPGPAPAGLALIPETPPEVVEAARRKAMEDEAARKRAGFPGLY